MDTARSASRRGPLLALALAATTALSVLSPAVASTRADGTGALVDVVVTSTSSSVAAVADAVRAAGGTVRDALPLAGGVSAQLPAGTVLAPAYRVVPNAPIELASKKVAGGREATAIRAALDLGAPTGEGEGVTIAVVDTGVAEVADLAGRVTHVDVSGSWEQGELRDAYGHGTFVAGAAAGDGSSSGGEYAGVAPGAHVLDVRVADEKGETDLVTVLRGLEEAKTAGADVVNLSMASGSPLPYQVDPLTTALAALWRSGVVVVVPSGNDGPERGSIASPGVDPRLLTVGSLDERLSTDRTDDVVPPFSGQGPAPQGVAKPDLVAPGQSLVSLRATGSHVDRKNADARIDDDYFRGSGTSFSTAVVAGAAAVLLAQDEDLTPDQVKATVTGTAYTAPGLADPAAAGAGGLDVAEALASPVTTPVDGADVDVPPGDPAVWAAFVQALADRDRKAAANSWSQLGPEAHRWVAHRWTSLTPEAHRWMANSWSAHRWLGGADGDLETWGPRLWAAHRWVAHRWLSLTPEAHRWMANSWSAHRWVDADLAAHRWVAHRWMSEGWSAHRWVASQWAASRWA